MTTDPEVERALTDAMMRRHQAEGLHQQLETARAHAEESAARAKAAAERMTTKQHDVERLEDLSWARIVAVLRGSRDQDLEREQAEADAARYTAATEKARAEADARTVSDLVRRLDELGDVDASYAAALAAKETWLRTQDTPDAHRLSEVAEEQGRLTAETHELDEAEAAGRDAERHLAEAMALLDSAASWSTWDTFGGGGMLTDMAKHAKMEQAQARLADADRALKAFDRELADVNRGLGDDLHLDGLTFAFDVWFDNFFSDLGVLRRIDKARDAVAATRVQVRDLRLGLRRKRQEADQRRTALDAERDKLLTAH
ncbi:MAG: hypothetical protein FWE71_10425 [Nocardioidaceae bacterium]|nr:hypothetical protein [Nocardioidaceae bacterium]MCL2614383.1 hypothetical protein [Nocardioidaceae bacterium]